MENEFQWLVKITQNNNDRLLELVKITSSHSMALKIVSSVIAILMSGFVVILMGALKKWLI